MFSAFHTYILIFDLVAIAQKTDIQKIAIKTPSNIIFPDHRQSLSSVGAAAAPACEERAIA